MPIYKFHCTICKKYYDKLVNMSQEYDQCPECNSLMKRTHCDLPSEPVLYGDGFYKQSKRTSVE